VNFGKLPPRTAADYIAFDRRLNKPKMCKLQQLFSTRSSQTSLVSAKGAFSYQPGATPQALIHKRQKG